MAAIPEETPLRGITHCTTSTPLWGSTIPPWVPVRFSTILLAVTMWGLVLGRLPPTPAGALTWRLVRTPCPTIPPARTCRLVFEPSTATAPATTSPGLALTGPITTQPGASNAAVGGAALYNNSTGAPNTATGYQALNKNTTGRW